MKKHALIVEDDPLVSHALEDQLMRLGFNSFEKSWTEEDGVAAAARTAPDIVVVGENLAEGSPIETARRIAQMHDVPILLVAHKSSRDGRRLPAGASMSGPYPLEAMAKAVGEASPPPAPVLSC